MASAQTTEGKTYYVDAQLGNDGNDGSASRPLRTLAIAVKKLSLGGGDRLVLSGSFRETLALQGINRSFSGSPIATRWTVIESARDNLGRPTAKIDGGVGSSAASFPFDKRGLPAGFGPGTGDYLDRAVAIKQCNYIRLRGLELHGVAGAGIVGEDVSHLDFDGLTVEWLAESAMLLSNAGVTAPLAHDLTIQNCRINQCNLGAWLDQATAQGFNMKPEAVSIVAFDGFRVIGNHLSNGFMEGIDFKIGSRNGAIVGNTIENLRSAAIYANEGRDTVIAHNFIRCIGWYDPQDGTGLVLSAPYLSQKLPGMAKEQGATGILVSNGDLTPLAETGRVSGIWVFENIVSWTRKDAISIVNRWRTEGRPGWVVDGNHVFNNVAHRSCQGLGTAAISIDASSTGSTVLNNIILESALSGLEIFDAQAFPFFTMNAISNNLFWANAVNGVVGGLPVLADPLLAVPASPGAPASFELSLGSPAIDAGIPIGFIFSNTTPTDIGARQSNVLPWRAGIAKVSP